MEPEIKNYAQQMDAELKHKNDIWELSKVIAERKAFLSKKKLTYHAKIRVDNSAKVVTFSEYLAEKGSGLSGGSGGFDDDLSPGIGFKATTYSSTPKGRTGGINEQSKLFGKSYTYSFEYQAVRRQVEAMAKAAGFRFDYKILPSEV